MNPALSPARYVPGASSEPTSDVVATFKTSRGDIRFRLRTKDATATVAMFVDIAKRGRYDGSRLASGGAGILVEGSAPTKLVGGSLETTTWMSSSVGNPGDRIAPASMTGRLHEAGTLDFLRFADKQTVTTRFYLSLTKLPTLDGSSTAFGTLFEGADVLGRLRPGDTIQSVTIEPPGWLAATVRAAREKAAAAAAKKAAAVAAAAAAKKAAAEAAAAAAARRAAAAAAARSSSSGGSSSRRSSSGSGSSSRGSRSSSGGSAAPPGGVTHY